MPVYHIVLFKLKPAVSKESIAHFSQIAGQMVGKIPGLTKLDVNGPLAATAARGKGYDMGLVAILEKPEDVVGYGAHPAHKAVQDFRESLCTDTLAFDLEY